MLFRSVSQSRYTLEQLAPYKTRDEDLLRYELNGHRITYYTQEIPLFGREAEIDYISPVVGKVWVKLTDDHGVVQNVPVFLELLKPISKRKIYWASR